MEIDQIIKAIQTDKIRITNHAYEEAQSDKINFNEIISSVINGEVIESYPKDNPYPSCLIFGFNFQREPIHSVWGYNAENKWAVLITVYRPDPNSWLDWKIRRK